MRENVTRRLLNTARISNSEAKRLDAFVIEKRALSERDI